MYQCVSLFGSILYFHGQVLIWPFRRSWSSKSVSEEQNFVYYVTALFPVCQSHKLEPVVELYIKWKFQHILSDIYSIYGLKRLCCSRNQQTLACLHHSFLTVILDVCAEAAWQDFLLMEVSTLTRMLLTAGRITCQTTWPQDSCRNDAVTQFERISTAQLSNWF